MGIGYPVNHPSFSMGGDGVSKRIVDGLPAFHDMGIVKATVSIRYAARENIST